MAQKVGRREIYFPVPPPPNETAKLERHFGVTQLNLEFIIFIVLFNIDELSSRFRMLNHKTCVINSVPESTVYKNKWALQVF